MNEPKTSIPIMTAAVFAQQTGLPLGVVNAQLDRRLLPVLKIGKRRFVNLTALRVLAEQSEGAALPQRSEEGRHPRTGYKVRRAA